MIGAPLCRPPGHEIPPAAAGLAALVVPACIGQDLSDLLRRGGCQRGWVKEGIVVGHEPKLGGEKEQNKNNI
jgi:hypothetical protein